MLELFSHELAEDIVSPEQIFIREGQKRYLKAKTILIYTAACRKPPTASLPDHKRRFISIAFIIQHKPSLFSFDKLLLSHIRAKIDFKCNPKRRSMV